jgi:toxin CptA
MKMQLQFKLQPSQYLATMLLVAHSATLVALFQLSFPFWAKVSVALFVLFSLLYQLKRVAWLSEGTATVALKLEGELIVMTTRGGALLTGRILSDSLVTPYLTVLNILPEGARFARSVIIMSDSLDAESFRQLRVWLKWGAL